MRWNLRNKKKCNIYKFGDLSFLHMNYPYSQSGSNLSWDLHSCMNADEYYFKHKRYSVSPFMHKKHVHRRHEIDTIHAKMQAQYTRARETRYVHVDCSISVSAFLWANSRVVSCLHSTSIIVIRSSKFDPVQL